ncbi:hypothetical protein GW17_00035839 [Ensete ventricosum]|nr:hypothetical protein GW17_00035839 [Ensete ventricosum]
MPALSENHFSLLRLVMGWLRFLEAGRKIYCINSPSTVSSIPYPDTKFTPWMNLLELGFAAGLSYSCVSRGSRREEATQMSLQEGMHRVCCFGLFLCLLVEHLHLPVYCLVDCDPYGFDILMVYRFGSMQMAYDANLLRVPEISWLGVFHSDLQKYHLPDRCLLKLTADGHLNILSCYFICLLQWK